MNGASQCSSPALEPPGSDYINRKELASRFRKSVRTIDRWKLRGFIPAIREDGIVCFSWAAVQQRLREKTVVLNGKHLRAAKKAARAKR